MAATQAHHCQLTASPEALPIVKGDIATFPSKYGGFMRCENVTWLPQKLPMHHLHDFAAELTTRPAWMLFASWNLV